MILVKFDGTDAPPSMLQMQTSCILYGRLFVCAAVGRHYVKAIRQCSSGLVLLVADCLPSVQCPLDDYLSP